MSGQTDAAIGVKTPPTRPLLLLPILSRPNTETDTDRKLKNIQQHGILTIDGVPYKTEAVDLEHLSDLGHGTSGNVVKMRHKPSGAIIAVKQMRRTGNSEENKRILMDLKVVLKSHDCPYIVQCFGCLVRDPEVWVCMELMSMCFDKLLKLSKLPVPEDILGKVTVATVKALSYLKEKHGVIHRDVKPSNILIDERGNIKLCDFGISGQLVDSKAQTRSAGCAAYMAPERIDPKKPQYDIRADVWSLGITLIELATARSPYQDCNTDFEVLTQIYESDPPSLPHGEGYNFSPEFHDFVSKCLIKFYQDRPKYPELLEQPFIKYYELTEVDVPQWFKMLVETAGIKTHHRNFDISTTTTTINNTTTLATRNAIENNYKKCDIKSIITTTTTATNAMTIHNTTTMNISKIPITTTAAATITTHLPAYQQYDKELNRQQHQQHQQQQLRKDAFLMQLPPQQLEHQHQQQQQPFRCSQLPKPIENFYKTTMNPQMLLLDGRSEAGIVGERGVNIYEKSANGNGSSGVGSYSGSGSSSANSNSPQSPPSIAHATGGSGINRSLDATVEDKLYRKSPLLQRKYSAGSSSAGNYRYGGMEANIAQSNIRHLATSPFNQRKQYGAGIGVTTRQTIIDPLWHMPALQSQQQQHEDYVDYDICDVRLPAQVFVKKPTTSPAMTRKRYTSSGSSTAEYKDNYALIPNNGRMLDNTVPAAVVPGNCSPLVLQRFYHQQNQLREKGKEKHLQQEFNNGGNTSTTSSNNSSNHQQQQHYNNSQIPIITSPTAIKHINSAGAFSSQHSQQQQQQQQMNSSQLAYATAESQQRNSYSPANSPPGNKSLHDRIESFASRLGSRYNATPRSNLPMQNFEMAAGSSDTSTATHKDARVYGATKKNSFKDEHGE